MKITLQNVGKRFNREWIFKNISFIFQDAKFYAITGPNGCGKSTLLQMLAASLTANEGAMLFLNADRELLAEEIYKHIAFAAPYLELIEEMTALEFLHFHSTFKPLIKSISAKEILSAVSLENAAHKQIRDHSSGMKQRLNLAQAVFSDVPVLLLDEPCTNFDEAGYKLYYRLIDVYCKNRLVIISSNDEREYTFCEERLHIPDYKKILSQIV
ncbi:MAG: ABC transporter ATP-binding protein [Parafilimonas sp.]